MDKGRMAISFGLFFCLLGLIASYPGFVIGDFLYNHGFKLDSDRTISVFYVWLITTAVLFLLKLLRAYWLIVVAYLVTFPGAIFLAIRLFNDIYGDYHSSVF